MEQELISKQEWVDWCSLRPTKQLVKALFEKREELKEGLVEERELPDLVIIGRCQALKDEIDYIMHDFDYIERYQNNELEASSSPDNS